MVKLSNQFASFNQSQLEAALKIAEVAAEQIEKLAEAQFNAAKATYADSLKMLRQLAAAKDVSELASVTAGMAEPARDKATAYARNLFDAVASAQAKVAATLEQQVTEFNENTLHAVEAAMKSAPAGSEPTVAAVKAAIHYTNSVLRNHGESRQADVQRRRGQYGLVHFCCEEEGWLSSNRLLLHIQRRQPLPPLIQ